MKTRIEQLILPARKAVWDYVLQVMCQTYTQIGAAIGVAQLEHSTERFPSWKKCFGLSALTLREVADNCGIIEEWVESGAEGSKPRLIMEFLELDRLRTDLVKAKYHNAFTKWSREDDVELQRLYEGGMPVEQLSSRFERNPNAIRLRLGHLGFELGADAGIPRRQHGR